MFSFKEFTAAKLVGQVKDQHLECCRSNVCTEWNLLSRNLLTRLSLLAGSECGESKDSKEKQGNKRHAKICAKKGRSDFYLNIAHSVKLCLVKRCKTTRKKMIKNTY